MLLVGEGGVLQRNARVDVGNGQRPHVGREREGQDLLDGRGVAGALAPLVADAPLQRHEAVVEVVVIHIVDGSLARGGDDWLDVKISRHPASRGRRRRVLWARGQKCEYRQQRGPLNGGFAGRVAMEWSGLGICLPRGGWLKNGTVRGNRRSRDAVAPRYLYRMRAPDIEWEG